MQQGESSKRFESILEVLRKSISGSSNSILKPEGFDQNFENHILKALNAGFKAGYEECIRDARKNEGFRQNFEEESHKFSEFLNSKEHNVNHKKKQYLTSSYKRMYDLYDDTIQKRKEILNIDLQERIRFLVFRIATAIGIAGVVLLTAYIAHKYGIPLPLSGIRQVATGG